MAERIADTIAVIDDDEAVRQSLAFLLGTVDYRVETFASAVEFLARGSNQYACLILDQHLPDMTGLELVQQLRSKVARIPVMLLSGGLVEAERIRAHQLEIETVLDKPADQDEILAFVASRVRHPGHLAPAEN
jgi:two-component system, LuxR family, response regulator FixJ